MAGEPVTWRGRALQTKPATASASRVCGGNPRPQVECHPHDRGPSPHKRGWELPGPKSADHEVVRVQVGGACRRCGDETGTSGADGTKTDESRRRRPRSQATLVAKPPPEGGSGVEPPRNERTRTHRRVGIRNRSLLLAIRPGNDGRGWRWVRPREPGRSSGTPPPSPRAAAPSAGVQRSASIGAMMFHWNFW